MPTHYINQFGTKWFANPDGDEGCTVDECANGTFLWTYGDTRRTFTKGLINKEVYE